MAKRKQEMNCCLAGCMVSLMFVGLICMTPVWVIVLTGAAVANAPHDVLEQGKDAVLGFLQNAANAVVPHPCQGDHCTVGGGEPGSHGTVVAQAALMMAQHLSGVPDNVYTSMPQPARTYWNSVCPQGTRCWSLWQSGNLQCVMFVQGAFGYIGDDLPKSGNAIDFYGNYAHLSGWKEIAPGTGLPAAGDMIVWRNSPPNSLFGHIAIVIQVIKPDAKTGLGSVTFVQANGPRPIETQVLLSDGQVETYAHSQVITYIRQT